MRHGLVLGGVIVVAATATIALAVRSGEPRPTGARRALRPASELAPLDAKPVSRDAARGIATRVFSESSVTRDDVVSLLAAAVAARRAGDHEKCAALMAQIAELGPGALRWLADIVLGSADEDEAVLAALALQKLAGAEAVPFALALLRTDRPAGVLGVALEILTRFRAAEAAPYVELILFAAGGDPHLRELSIAFFRAMGPDGVPVLARAIAEPSLGTLRERAAEALAAIGTPEAGRALHDVWHDGFSGTSVASNYFLLRSLAKFPPEQLKEMVRAALDDANLSRGNVLLSMLAHVDRAFALEQLRGVLAADVAPHTRGQAIAVLGAIGGADAQAVLLDIMSRPRSDGDLVESANALMRQKRMEIPFEKVHDLYAATEHPLVRAVLASVLAKYDEPLAADRAMTMALVDEAERGVAATDATQRAVSIQVSAQLARHTPDPAGHLQQLYGRLQGPEVDEHPMVFAELARHAEDGRVRPILESSLEDERAGTPRRMLAAQGLMQAGGVDRVYHTIERSESRELTSFLVGLVVAREGQAGAQRVTTIARSVGDPERRRALEDQIKAFSYGN